MNGMINYHHNNNHHGSSNYDEKMQRTQEYIDALEEERRKILVFQRELPLCLELVTQAIEACKQQLSSGTTVTEYNFHGQSECSEQTSTDGPVLEEFMPIKRALSSDDDEQQSRKPKKSNISNNGNDNDNKSNNNNDKAASSKKSDWLRSVQLWNQTPDPPQKGDSPKKVSVVEVKRNGSGGGAFHPFKKEKSTGANAAKLDVLKSDDKTSTLVAEASSTEETGGTSGGGGGNVGSKKEEKEGQSQRKSRRCWSPELHKRFLLALQQLGGAHVATPKQIRELMKVDGLTNDEVKSHLQKYRLHNRRPSPSIHSNNNPQAPQFVVVGGIWVPPPEYTPMAATTGSGEASGGANSNGIYAPIPTLPPPFQDPSASLKQQKHKQLHSDDRGSNSGGGLHSNSQSTSSSTDTATTSPNY